MGHFAVLSCRCLALGILAEIEACAALAYAGSRASDTDHLSPTVALDVIPVGHPIYLADAIPDAAR